MYKLFSSIFFSETAWPIKAKFNVEPPWVDLDLFYNNVKFSKTYLYKVQISGEHLQNHWSSGIVKLGFTGVYIIFLFFAQKHRLWVPVGTALLCRFKRVPTIYVLSKNMKNIIFFISKF